MIRHREAIAIAGCLAPGHNLSGRQSWGASFWGDFVKSSTNIFTSRLPGQGFTVNRVGRTHARKGLFEEIGIYIGATERGDGQQKASRRRRYGLATDQRAARQHGLLHFDLPARTDANDDGEGLQPRCSNAFSDPVLSSV